MSWTEPSDVTGAWIGDDKPEDDLLVRVWIEKAEREIRRRVPDIQARIDAEAEAAAGTDLADTAVDVTVAMVVRVFRNPDGARQKQWTEGPFSQSMTVGGDNPGTLYLTGEELAALQGVQPSGAFSVDMLPTTSPFYPSGTVTSEFA
jgi:hypothetical protein